MPVCCPMTTEEHAFKRDLRWLARHQGLKFDAVVFHDVVNRFMADGKKEETARELALETLRNEFFKRV